MGIGKSDVFSVVGGDSVLSLLVLLDTSVFHQCGDLSIDGYLFKEVSTFIRTPSVNENSYREG